MVHLHVIHNRLEYIDTNKFGQRMLEKMGWTEGSGLGANRQGAPDAVKIDANYSRKGNTTLLM
jgi:hypothetical protein